MGITIILAMIFCLYKMTYYFYDLLETSKANYKFTLYASLTIMLGLLFLGTMINAGPGMFWHWTPIEK